MGFVNIEFGYFNFSKRKYIPKKFDNIELAALLGSIAWQNGKPSLHAHGVGAGKDFKARAGHILSAAVSTGTLEIMITVHDKKLERVKDEKLGANVLELED
jgi:predicted DNA-binding protein with PD1-like motif